MLIYIIERSEEFEGTWMRVLGIVYLVLNKKYSMFLLD